MARRKVVTLVEPVGPQLTGESSTAIAQAEASQNLAQREMDQHTTDVLERFGFSGYTVEGLIAEGALRARRFVEDILELGRIVLACRELGPGTYREAIEHMGIPRRTASRVAGVALKFLNQDHRKPLLTLDVGKVYELALLDDATLDEIAEDPDKFDDIERMSVSELRAALRESKAEIDAKDVVAEKTAKTIRKLQEKLARNKPTPEFLAAEALQQLDTEALECAAHICAGLRSALTTAMGAIDAHGADRQLIEQACAAAIGRVFAAARDLVIDFGIQPQEAGSLDMTAEVDSTWESVNQDLAKQKTHGKRAS